MTNGFDYDDIDWESIGRLQQWYSGDIHDSMEALGLWGYLSNISLLGIISEGNVICGPAVTVLFEPSERKGEPQDIYHRVIDKAPNGSVIICDASCAQGSCSGELMSTGAKTRGAVATVVNGTVRDLAQVRALGYPLFGTKASPVGVTGKKEPTQSQVPLEISGVTVRPKDIIFGDVDGVVVIPKERLRDVANASDDLGANEAHARNRILSGEKLQSIWPVS